MEQKSATVNVAQKRVSEPRAVCRTLDKSGDIRRDEACLSARRDYSEIGGKRGEMIVGYFGLCRADAREYRGFSDTGISYKSYVGEHLELKYKLLFLALCAVLCEHRHLTRGRCEMPVAPAASTALAAYKIRAVILGHIVNYLAACGVLYKRSGGNGYHKVLGGLAEEFVALAVLTVARDKFVLITESKQGIGALVNAENYASALAAVAAVGAAVRNVFLTVKGYRAVSAVARLNVNFNVIYKHKNAFLLLF